MFEPTGPWSPERTREYLTERTVPVRVATRTPGGRLWMLSLWYLFRDGAIWCATSASADVVGFIEDDPGVAFEISGNEPPYMGVRGSAEATPSPDEDKSLLRELVVRYLGGTDSALARRLLDADREEVRIRLDPTRAHTWDYSERMRDAVAGAEAGAEGNGEPGEDGA
ncbi:pyridoxamine 5'-phosphate oxidase [Halobacteriales archaeon QS_5_70_15]|nr:MAG: pyridoxamine 5'-phosphate oxidase [Halobacteriales archaeon QS_5_70_15]